VLAEFNQMRCPLAERDFTDLRLPAVGLRAALAATRRRTRVGDSPILQLAFFLKQKHIRYSHESCHSLADHYGRAKSASPEVEIRNSRPVYLSNGTLHVQ